MQSPSSSSTTVPNDKSSNVNKNSDIVQKAGELAVDDEDVQASLERTEFVKDANEYLKGKVGANINAKMWLEGCGGLDDLDKSEIIIRLVYEVCLAENAEYNLENDAAENERENNENKNFSTRRIFKILKNVNRLLLPQDRKKLVEIVCQNGNVKSLEMICRLEAVDGNKKIGMENKYPWKGEFTGYKTLIELLQYVLKQQCSSEIVLCIAKKLYGTHHNICNGKKYLEDSQIQSMEKMLDQPSSVMEECFKKAIELSYKDTVLVMLSGDIYQCIRLMKDQRFQEEERFRDALDMIEESVADVMSSWVKEKCCKSEVLSLLKEGTELRIEKMTKKDLRKELKHLEIKISRYEAISRERLVERYREGVRKTRLIKTVVGALISTLFFNCQNESMTYTKPFRLKLSLPDKRRRKKGIDQFNKNIDSKQLVQEGVLKSIQAMNSSSHVSSSWFFREVLEKVVNDNLDKLKTVCAAICKDKVEEFIKGVEVDEDVVDVLGFFNVEPNQIKTVTPKKIHSGVGIVPHFTGDIKNLVKGIRELDNPYLMVQEVLEITEGLASGKAPAFSGFSRRTIINLKSKSNKSDDETKDLEEKVSQIMDEIKRGVYILAKNANCEYRIYTEDIFRHFKIINSEIGKEDKRDILKLVCQNGNVKLLEMICKQEVKDKGYRPRVDQQYPWKGEFTGYEKLTDLLQCTLKQPCSPEIVLCIAKKVYGTHHNVCNGKKYLEDSQIQSMEKMLDQPSSVMEECLKKAIELSYKDTVLVMLSGDIYQCIRLMKDQRFQEEERFRDALDMIEEAVADVMSSWIKGNAKQYFKSEVLSLLKEGIEIDVEKMGEKRLVEKLRDGGRKVRLIRVVVGALISTLFFNHQNELMKDKKPFKLEISYWDQSKRKQDINEFNKNIASKKFVQEGVLKSIKALNSSSHVSNSWFFREVLEKVVNDNLDKLKTICTAVCKEPLQILLKGEEVHENVYDLLKLLV